MVPEPQLSHDVRGFSQFSRNRRERSQLRDPGGAFQRRHHGEVAGWGARSLHEVRREKPAGLLCSGAFELPFAAKRLAGRGGFDAIVALGAVIRGDTPHFDYVAGEAARGLQQVGLETGLPVIFGVPVSYTHLTLPTSTLCRSR